MILKPRKNSFRNDEKLQFIGLVKPSEKTKKQRGLDDDWRYHIYVDFENKKILCDCPWAVEGTMKDKKKEKPLCKHQLHYQQIFNNK